MATGGASEHSGDVLQRLAPGLRRFARALVAGRARVAVADELAGHALEHAGPGRDGSDQSLKIGLYQSVILGNRNRHASAASSSDGQNDAPRWPGRSGVAQAVERLPLDQREVLLLVVLERFTYDETAAILGLPRSSIVARLVRARGMLTADGGEDGSNRPTHLRVVK